MSKKTYIKEEPFVQVPIEKKVSLMENILKMMSMTFIFGGILLTSYIFLSPSLNAYSITTKIIPVTEDYFDSLLIKRRGFIFNELAGIQILQTAPPKIIPENYHLTIPSLGIKNAVVTSNSPSLSPNDSLGHLLGSALPGEKGEVFIYGHSTYPILFSPTNYQTIFSKLDKLKLGDFIEVSYLDRKYVYLVETIDILEPSAVEPKFNTTNYKQIALLTCYPFGTTKDRLLVRARQIN